MKNTARTSAGFAYPPNHFLRSQIEGSRSYRDLTLTS